VPRDPVREVGLFAIAVAAAAALALSRAGSAPPRPPERGMAGPGYIPSGAPLRPPPAPPPRGGAIAVDFDLLSAFDYDPEADVIPDGVTALDGRLVELRGVMYWGVTDPERVTEFYLMPNHMVCCFGTPRANQTVEVVLRPPAQTRYVLDYYLVRGRLAVGAVRSAEGVLQCLYRMTDATAEVMR
jgi:hypothetical protein